MRTCRLGFLVAAAVLHAALGRGQSLEVGGIVGTACRGIEGSALCGSGANVLSGQLIDRQRFVCQPSGCENLVPLLVGQRVGQERSLHLDLGFVAGASIRATNRVRFRFGIQLHDLAFEDLSTTAWFAETGFRFGAE